MKKLKKKQQDSEISDDLGEFIGSLYDTIKKCEQLVKKCNSMGKTKVKIKSIMKQASYAEKFSGYKEELQSLSQAATLLNLVGAVCIIHMFYV